MRATARISRVRPGRCNSASRGTTAPQPRSVRRRASGPARPARRSTAVSASGEHEGPVRRRIGIAASSYGGSSRRTTTNRKGRRWRRPFPFFSEGVIMSSMRRVVGVLIVLLAFAGSAYAQQSVKLRPFPKLRFGIGAEPTAGGGYLAGAPYNTRTAVIAWNRRHRDLTLYLIRAPSVNCRNFLRIATRPGNLIQALIKARPLTKYASRRLPNQTLQFITYYRNQPLHVSGLKQHVNLVLTSVDSYPGGVWHGRLDVPVKR